MSAKTYIEPQTTIPVYDECDVLVVGGGSAGHSAAIAAARAGCKNIVLTGVSLDGHSIGVAICTNGNYSFHFHEKVSRSSPGTGDVFASVFTGALLKGKNIFDSAEIASTFVVECLKETLKYPDHTYGPVFEPLLGKLIETMNN